MKNEEMTKTGDEISTKLGFKPTLAALSNWPEDNTVKFLEAPEIDEYCKFILDRYRKDLVNINVKCLFKPKARTSKNGNTIAGDVRIQNDLQKMLHSVDVLIIIGFDNWNAMDVDNKLRIAMHEIEKIIYDDKSGKLVTREPEVMQFGLVMQNFGPSSTAEIELIAAYNKFVKDNSGLIP